MTLVMGRIKIRCMQYQPPKGGLDIHRYLLAVELVVLSIDSTIFSYIGTRLPFQSACRLAAFPDCGKDCCRDRQADLDGPPGNAGAQPVKRRLLLNMKYCHSHISYLCPMMLLRSYEVKSAALYGLFLQSVYVMPISAALRAGPRGPGCFGAGAEQQRHLEFPIAA